MNQLNSLLSNSASNENSPLKKKSKIDLTTVGEPTSPDISLQSVDGPTSNPSEMVSKKKSSRPEIMRTRSYYKLLTSRISLIKRLTAPK